MQRHEHVMKLTLGIVQLDLARLVPTGQAQEVEKKLRDLEK